MYQADLDGSYGYVGTGQYLIADIIDDEKVAANLRTRTVREEKLGGFW